MEIPTNIEEEKEKIVKKSKGTASREVVHRPSRTSGVNIIYNWGREEGELVCELDYLWLSERCQG